MTTEPDVSSGYDPVELRRRIVVAFSAGELQKFADELGVAGAVRWDRGHAEAARDLVREFERGYGGLTTLVDRLRAAKPLVEWPEPGAFEAVGPASVDGPAAGPASIPHPFG
ncbi:MAG TPA: hypothetical protein VHB21_23645, partial [Minicystis sp.]|nr:hypothetical protein [Minicystis sp.]